MIKKIGSMYRVIAESGRNMGTYYTKSDASRRLKQIEMFKNIKVKRK